MIILLFEVEIFSSGFFSVIVLGFQSIIYLICGLRVLKIIDRLVLGAGKQVVVLNGIMSKPILCNRKLNYIIEILVLYLSSVGASGVVLDLNVYLTCPITKLPE